MHDDDATRTTPKITTPSPPVTSPTSNGVPLLVWDGTCIVLTWLQPQSLSSLDFWNGTMHMDIVAVVDDDDDATKYDPYDTEYDTNP